MVAVDWQFLRTNMTYKDINIIYEDNHLLVVVKPQNIPSQEDSSGDKDMLTLLKEYLVESKNKPGNAFLGLVHRLDRPTGGVMVFAKTSKAAARLTESIQNGTFEKKYLAVVLGEIKQKQGRLDNYLMKYPKLNVVKVVPAATSGAKHAVLDYKVLEVNNNNSLVNVNLYTGRSHQIRVQFEFAGYPLIGDIKYGGERSNKGCKLALWASELRFPHPTTGEILVFRVYPPVEDYPWNTFDIERHLSVAIRN